MLLRVSLLLLLWTVFLDAAPVTAPLLARDGAAAPDDESILSLNLVEAEAAVVRFFKNDLSMSIARKKHHFRTLFTCDLCKTATYFIERVFRWTKSKRTLISRTISFCKFFRFEEDDVCESIIPLYADMVIDVARNTSLTGDQICGIIFGSQCAGSIGVQWRVKIPSSPPKPPVRPLRPPPKGSPTKRILHLTDTHIDFQYAPGTNADCPRPLCCRKEAGVSEDADDSAAGYWGSNLKCDTPPWTFVDLLKRLKEQEKQEGKFDLIYWTGDVPAHNIWNQRQPDQLTVIQRVADLIDAAFPDTPIFPSLGNHEASPANSFPPRDFDGNHSMSWLYDRLERNWIRRLPKGFSPDTIKRGAFYSVLVEPGFRIISLNSNYCNNLNFWLLLNTTDPLGQLGWLVDELLRAEAAGEKVHILGHIPPGLPDCLKSWSFNFYSIVNRFESTIAGQFYGHTHFDEMEIFYDEATLKRPVNVAYVAPSVTTYVYLNPAYRVYTVDGSRQNSTRYVTESETYILNVTRANLENRTTWEREYAATEAYNLTTLFPADWNGLAHRMVEDRPLFDKYIQHFYNSYENHETDSDADILCRLVTGRSDDPDLCKEIVKDFKAAEKRRKRERHAPSGSDDDQFVFKKVPSLC